MEWILCWNKRLSGLAPSSQTLTVDPLIAVLGVFTTPQGTTKSAALCLVPRSDTITKRDEPHLATDNELVRNILLALLSSLAKLEALKISERTKSGMARAKANGIKIGRPKLAIEIRQKIAQRAAKGETPYAIAKALKIDRHTAAKYAQLSA